LLTCPISSDFVPFVFTESKNKFNSIQFYTNFKKKKGEGGTTVIHNKAKEFLTANVTELLYLNSALFPPPSIEIMVLMHNMQKAV